MVTHSSILAWRIPWTEKPGGLQSMKFQRFGHDCSNKLCVHQDPETHQSQSDFTSSQLSRGKVTLAHKKMRKKSSQYRKKIDLIKSNNS